MVQKSIVILGVSDFNGVSISGSDVKIASAALGTNDVELRTEDNYSLSLASDVTISSSTPETWLVKDDSIGYNSGSVSAGYVLDGKKISYKESLASATFSLTGLNNSRLQTYRNGEVEGVEIDGSEVKISESLLNQTTVTLATTDNFVLSIDDSLKGGMPRWEVSNGTAIYIPESKSVGYVLSLDKKNLQYNNESDTVVADFGNVTISGLNSDATVSDIETSGKNITIKNVSNSGTTISNDEVGCSFKLYNAGKMTYEGSAAASLLGSSQGNDSIINNGNNVYIGAMSGNNNITNSGNNVYIAGSPTDGKDTITSNGNNVSFNITTSNSTVTKTSVYSITGGTNHTFYWNAKSKGYNQIYGFNPANDLIEIQHSDNSSTDSLKSSVSGDDAYISICSGGTESIARATIYGVGADSSLRVQYDDDEVTLYNLGS